MIRSALLNHTRHCWRLQQQQQQHRCLVGWMMYSAKKGVDRDFLCFLQQPIDLSPQSIARWAQRKKMESLKEDHSMDSTMHDQLGPDLAAAHFIVRRGGAVKFANSNRWVQEEEEGGDVRLPDRRIPSFRLEAIDASGSQMMYVSIENFLYLRHLQYLNLSKCQYIDDWCIDRLQFLRQSLVCLDVSECPNVTEKGLAALHKLRLRCLRVHNMPNIKHQPLVKLMLQEMMPLCSVEGLEKPDEDTPDNPDLALDAAKV